MKVPLTWLKEFVATKLPPEEIAETLTLIGLEVDGIVEEDGDWIFEISLTPNLAHCASIRGVARELSAVTEEKLNTISPPKIPTSPLSINEKTSVSVENPKSCPRYMCRVIENVKVGPSPLWLKKRIEQCGQRSVNNVVDITNFVLLELGQPLHAFDLDQLVENRIVVRNAHNEKIVAIDGKERFLTEDNLVIADAKKPVAIAGVMGSSESEVTEKTTTVLLESAYFDPTEVRRSRKRLDVHSEASYRFERGVDPNGIEEALERATSLICEIAQGTALKGKIDISAHTFHSKIVSCRLSRINKVLGTQLAMGEVETLFRRLGFAIHEIKSDTISVKAPTYRHDIHGEIDLIEETARIYGFDNIRKKEKALYRMGNLPHSSLYLFEKEIRFALLTTGLQEFLTCNLISPDETALISQDILPSRSLIKILNPSSEEQSVLRPTLLPGLLKAVKFNFDHEVHTVSGFEIGRVHFKSKDKFLEPSVAAIILAGKRGKPQLEAHSENCDFFDLKGIIENLLATLKLEAKFVKSSHENFHPGRQSKILIGEVEVGTMGEVHPLTLKKIDLKEAVFYAELNLEDLKNLIKKEIKFHPLPQFPSSTRDFTVTLNQNVHVQELFNLIDSHRKDLLESYSLLDVYVSEKIGKEKKNVTLRFVYRDRKKTISMQEMEKEHQRITDTIQMKFKGETT